ncbi:hypothetical protein J3458_008900 [Metarhizium acridum]|uniref:uncharacterized protein n=1 Tax=Metarhizium acridum TaxID=92637 RepID=UPI001C6B5660|nr:hypothetical protein J3458_008900 [Metarhizium acridum]
MCGYPFIRTKFLTWLPCRMRVQVIWLGGHSETRRYLDKKLLRTSIKLLGEVERDALQVFVDNRREKSKRNVLPSAKADETIQRLEEMTATVMALVDSSSNCYLALTLGQKPGIPSSIKTPQ